MTPDRVEPAQLARVAAGLGVGVDVAARPARGRGARSRPATSAGRCCRWPTARPESSPRSPSLPSARVAAGQRRLVQHVLGQAHVGGVDERAVAPDGADAVGLRPRGRPRSPPGRRRPRRRSGRTPRWRSAIWLGWIAHLPSKPSRLACTARAPVARRGPGTPGTGASMASMPAARAAVSTCTAGEVPEVAGVVADRVEVAVDPGPQRRRQVAGAEDDRLERGRWPGRSRPRWPGPRPPR